MSDLPQTVSIEFAVPEPDKDLWIADLWEHGCTGILESELPRGRVWLRAFFDEPLPDGLRPLVNQPGTRIVRHAEKDWVAESRALWQPFPVGSKFYLVPDWRNDPAPEGRFPIYFNPGLACGTGSHEATQLCFEALERYVESGLRVVDVGCGSGILCIAATLLGAGEVTGYDLDPTAVGIARDNLARAGVRGEIVLGPLQMAADESFDIAVCNISPEAAIELAPELHRVLAPGGVAVLSGFESPELGEVLSAINSLGLRVIEENQKGNWCSVVYAKASGGAG